MFRKSNFTSSYFSYIKKMKKKYTQLKLHPKRQNSFPFTTLHGNKTQLKNCMLLPNPLNRFYPKIYVDSIYDVPYKRLIQRNIEGLIFDIDNTLAPFDIDEPNDKLVKFIAKLKSMGFKICLVSNNKECRVQVFNKKLSLPVVAKAGKPKLSGIRKAIDMIGTECEKTALIGDQVFTDMWCGNRLSMTTVLVKPIANRDEFTVKLKRGLEKIVIRIYLKGRQKR